MNKNEIIKLYQKARTIKELESIKGEVWCEYKQLFSYEQKVVHKTFIKKVDEFNENK